MTVNSMRMKEMMGMTGAVTYMTTKNMVISFAMVMEGPGHVQETSGLAQVLEKIHIIAMAKTKIMVIGTAKIDSLVLWKMRFVMKMISRVNGIAKAQTQPRATGSARVNQ